MEGPILIAGAGALGSVFGAMLRAHQNQIAMLGRRAHLDAIAEHGLELQGLFGRHVACGFTLADNPDRLEGRFPLILLTVKSYDTRPMASAIAPHLADDGIIVSLQNGLGNLEMLAECFGARRVLGARVIFGAEIPSPGAVRVTVFAEPVAIGPAPAIHCDATGEMARAASLIAETIAQAGIPAQSCADIVPVIWTKVLYNAALNPLGALLKLSYGALADDPGLREIMDKVIEEAFAVARALDVALPFARADEYRALFYGKLVPSTCHHRPSMLHDLERRGRTEIGALNGRIVELADRLGIGAEVNRALTALIRASEKRALPLHQT